MAFSGTFDYTLDAKNRLTVPAKFRSSLTEAVVLARGTERCVTIWPKRDFERFVAVALEGLHPLSVEADQLKRYFFATSFDTELDSAGRVMVPPRLLGFAGLTKDVVVNGMDDRIEVWDRQAWADYDANLDYASLARAVVPGARAAGPEVPAA